MGMFAKKGDSAVLAKLNAAPSPYKEIGQRLHEIIKESAPELEPVLRWGIPFYTRNGEDVCYIKSDKDYLVFGFGETINPAFREGETMHPVVWSITSLNPETEQELSRLIKLAAA
ncbi:hypothetical protein AUR04nite_15980 [Glutamicibacter uratoxydans]|uniref:YdhG-like domain-containing protein n=1 Tax=Glutamicibacter uratoxydans TaxID=43667 RepID=A0A4Y4DMA6_GLUUR|nr:DUF1801 domain-containing protein [Glutamicibacter uratoxydans]GED06066.1 hypothetical protein AUR04nite_15980 [Glutamicibacter uratoxydans]